MRARDLGEHVLRQFGPAVLDALCIATDFPGAAVGDSVAARRAEPLRAALESARVECGSVAPPRQRWSATLLGPAAEALRSRGDDPIEDSP